MEPAECARLGSDTGDETSLAGHNFYNVFALIFLECGCEITMITFLESRLSFHMLFNVLAQILLECCCEITMVTHEKSETC